MRCLFCGHHRSSNGFFYFICIAMLYSYYMFVFEFCLFRLCWESWRHALLVCLILIVYHILFACCLLSLYHTKTRTSTRIPSRFRLTDQEMRDIDFIEQNQRRADVDEYLQKILSERRLKVRERRQNGEIRLCSRCQLIKPDRTHHCSACDACCLMMDHHCYLLGTCVGFHNFKFFCLYMFYTAVYILFCYCCSIPYLISKRKTIIRTEGVLFVFQACLLLYFGATFILTTFIFLAINLRIILRNKTTIESMRDPNFSWGQTENAYDLGTLNNWKQRFGQNGWTEWLSPVPTHTATGNGHDFPIRTMSEMTLTHPSKDPWSPREDGCLCRKFFAGPQIKRNASWTRFNPV